MASRDAMPAPLISVLMPVRDGERFLGAALDSLRSQTLGDFEAIVVDDGSLDGTPSLLTAAAAREPRLRIERQDQAGIAVALNRALALATGRFAARLDADDIAMPDRFARQAAYLEAHPRVAVLGTGYAEIDADGRVLRRVVMPADPGEIRRILPRTNCLAHPSVMMRREALLAAGGYRPALAGAEDYDLWLRLLGDWDLANLPEALIGYRRHAAAGSLQSVRQHAFAELAARAAFERRAAGLPELLDASRPIDRDALLRIGLPAAAIDRHLVKRLMVAARAARRSGAEDRVRDLVRQANALLPRGDLRARLDFAWRRLKLST
jgi:Glycosyl transferase family 2